MMPNSELEEMEELQAQAAFDVGAVFAVLAMCRSVRGCYLAHGHTGLHAINVTLDAIYITRRQDERKEKTFYVDWWELV